MKFNHPVARWSVVIGLACGAAVSHAQDGFSVRPEHQSLIQPGMTQSEVQQAIGRPSRDARYGVARGSTWVYSVTGNLEDVFLNNSRTVFEVDFDANGKVVSAQERTLHRSSSGVEVQSGGF